MPARRDGRGIVRRPEGGRSGEENDVGAGVDHLLEGVEADKDPLRRNVDLGRRAVGQQPLIFAEPAQRALGVVLEDVAHGHQADVLAGAEAVDDRAGASAAAADQGDLQLVAAGGMGRPRDVQSSGQGDARRGGRRALEKFST